MVVKEHQTLSLPNTSKAHIITFFGGTLLSSIGSFAFTTGAMTFMVKGDFPVTYVGFWVGFCRLTGVISSLLFGDLADRYPARRFLVKTEIIALLLSIGLLTTWHGGRDSFSLFFLLSLIRAAILPLQQGARSKISKAIAGSEFTKNLRTAIWLNKATQGATVFSALICIYAAKALSFEYLIIFDGLTFFFSTILLLSLPDEIAAAPAVISGPSVVLSKLGALYRFNPRAALYDCLLCLAFTGVNLTVVRLAGPEKDMIPLLVALGGLCLWFAGPIACHSKFEKSHGLIWGLFGLSWGCFWIGSGRWSFACLLVPFILQRLTFFALRIDTPE